MIPILYHAGGDWYFSAMERLWWFVAHYAARDRRREHEDRFLERQLEVAREIQPVFGTRPVATGGNPPKRSECAPYCKCIKHYNNITPPKRPEET